MNIHTHSYVRVLGFFSLPSYVLTLANACNGGRITFSTCSMHMQLGVTYHIPKGASKNGLPVKYTFKLVILILVYF